MLAGIVVPPPAVVVVVLIVIIVGLAMDVVVLSAVVGGRLLHEHCGGTVEQFCKWLSGRQNKSKPSR